MKNHELALLFLRKAAEDEAIIDEVLHSERVSDAMIGFHCQQTAEKLLKALLCELGVDFRRTHDLKELGDLLAGVGCALSTELLEVRWLTPYAVEFRYPDDMSQTPLDRAATRELLRRLRLHVGSQVPT